MAGNRFNVGKAAHAGPDFGRDFRAIAEDEGLIRPSRLDFGRTGIEDTTRMGVVACGCQRNRHLVVAGQSGRAQLGVGLSSGANEIRHSFCLSWHLG